MIDDPLDPSPQIEEPQCGRSTIIDAIEGAEIFYEGSNNAASDQGAQIVPFTKEKAERKKIGPSDNRGSGDPPKQPPSGGGDNDAERVFLLWENRNHHQCVHEIAQILSADPPLIFQRGGNVVRPDYVAIPFAKDTLVTSCGFREVSLPTLQVIASRRIIFTRFDRRMNAEREISPPEKLLSALLTGAAGHIIPQVRAVIACPSLRSDGSIISKFGYDRATGVYYFEGDKIDVGEITNPVSRELAEEALADLAFLISGFPFVAEIDRSTGLSFLLTSVCRTAFKHAPIFAITAHSAGTGKTFLADIGCYLATGMAAPVMAASEDREEFEKRLIAALLAGHSFVILDNVNGVLKSNLLCQALTQLLIKIRPLGVSRELDIISSQSFIATGNGLMLSGDLIRRGLLCRLDAKLECPERRSFDFDPLATLKSDRARYVRAALILVRFGMASPLELSPHAGFEDWGAIWPRWLNWGCLILPRA